LWTLFCLLAGLLAFKTGYSCGYYKGFSDSVRRDLMFRSHKDCEHRRNGLN